MSGADRHLLLLAPGFAACATCGLGAKGSLPAVFSVDDLAAVLATHDEASGTSAVRIVAPLEALTPEARAFVTSDPRFRVQGVVEPARSSMN